jgi:hypothetical protein
MDPLERNSPLELRKFRTDFRLCLPLLSVAVVLSASATLFAVMAVLASPLVAAVTALPTSLSLLALAAAVGWGSRVVWHVALKDTYRTITVDDDKMSFQQRKDWREIPWSMVRNVITSPAAVEIVTGPGESTVVTANLLDFDDFKQIVEARWDELKHEANERTRSEKPDLVPYEAGPPR